METKRHIPNCVRSYEHHGLPRTQTFGNEDRLATSHDNCHRPCCSLLHPALRQDFCRLVRSSVGVHNVVSYAFIRIPHSAGFTAHFPHHTSHFLPHTSHLTPHTSHITHHTSPAPGHVPRSFHKDRPDSKAGFNDGLAHLHRFRRAHVPAPTIHHLQRRRATKLAARAHPVFRLGPAWGTYSFNIVNNRT